MKSKFHKINKLMLVTMTCFSLALFFAPLAYADADQPGVGEKAIQDRPLSRQQVILEKKNSQMVSTVTGKKFKIGNATMIIDPNGKQVHIRRMQVPCDAMLSYQSGSEGNPMLHRIEILSVHGGATNRMLDKPN